MHNRTDRTHKFAFIDFEQRQLKVANELVSRCRPIDLAIIHSHAPKPSVRCLADVSQAAGKDLGGELPDTKFADHGSPVLIRVIPLGRERNVPKIAKALFIHRHAVIENSHRCVVNT